jgi:PhnB protein
MSKPDRMSWVSPYLIVKDVDQSLRFYNGAFGFDSGRTMRDDRGVIVHAETFHHDSCIMMGAQSPENTTRQSPKISGHASPVSLYLYCDDVDAMYARALKHGATSIDAPEDMFYGDRRCTVEGVNGYQWCFACPV